MSGAYRSGPKGTTTILMRRFRRQMDRRSNLGKVTKRARGQERQLSFDLRRNFNLREMSDAELDALEAYIKWTTGETDHEPNEAPPQGAP